MKDEVFDEGSVAKNEESGEKDYAEGGKGE